MYDETQGMPTHDMPAARQRPQITRVDGETKHGRLATDAVWMDASTSTRAGISLGLPRRRCKPAPDHLIRRFDDKGERYFCVCVF